MLSEAISAAKALHNQPKDPDLIYEDPDVVYTTTSIKETLCGLLAYILGKIYSTIFFICILTKRLLFGEKKIFVSGRTPLLQTMRAMEITEKEATKFFQLFEKIDKDHSGSIEITEFFDFFKLEMTDFAKRSFEVMDFDRQTNSVGSLHYGEFFVSMWNFCTLSHETLVKFTFDLYDTDGSGELSEKEIFNMVRMMRPSSNNKDADRETKKLMAVMDKEDVDLGTKDNMVSFQEFMDAHRKMGSVIFPAFQLQRQIRLKSMSKKFWRNATDKRQRLFPTNLDDVGTGDLIELYKNFCNEKEEPPEEDSEQDEFEAQAQQDAEAEAQLLKNLEAQKEAYKLKQQQEKEQWAKDQDLQFTDAPSSYEEEEKKAGFILALAKSKFKSKIYHTPREGEWWSETPDVRGPPIIFGKNGRPNSAMFKTEKQHLYDSEPLVIVERSMADLMSEADKAKTRARKNLRKAKRSIRSAKGEGGELVDYDSLESGKARPWSGLVSWKTRQRYSRIAGQTGAGVRKLYDPANVVGESIKREMQKRNVHVHVPEQITHAASFVPKLEMKRLGPGMATRPKSASSNESRKVVDFTEPTERDKKKKRPKTAH